jgi:hypothetical protein
LAAPGPFLVNASGQDELASELRALQDISQRERDITKEPLDFLV